jgi:hypothetical protein
VFDSIEHSSVSLRNGKLKKRKKVKNIEISKIYHELGANI